MLPCFADIFQQGNRWLNWYHRQPEGSVRPVVIEAQKSWPAAPRLWGTSAGAVLTPDVVIQKSLLLL